MKKISFKKYTLHGNHFVIIDTIAGMPFTEAELKAFAHEVTNNAFGVGADNLLVIQPSSPMTLKTIAEEHGYWPELPNPVQTDFLFRMFEPSGEEALCCGNGLMCIAEHLRRQYGIWSARIMTEVPLAHPNTVNIGSLEPGRAWAEMGHPRRIPSELLNSDETERYDNAIDYLQGVTVRFQLHELKPYVDENALSFSAYLVFTGEPHLVVFPQWHCSIPEFAYYLFPSFLSDHSQGELTEKRWNFGNWLVNRIGTYLNTHYRHLFPAGINVNFAHPVGPAAIEYRCFERGIYRETLACGTGALAVAFVARRLQKLEGATIRMLPRLCRRYYPDAHIRVRRTETGWRIEATPRLVFEGIHHFAADIALDNLIARPAIRQKPCFSPVDIEELSPVLSQSG